MIVTPNSSYLLIIILIKNYRINAALIGIKRKGFMNRYEKTVLVTNSRQIKEFK